MSIHHPSDLSSVVRLVATGLTASKWACKHCVVKVGCQHGCVGDLGSQSDLRLHYFTAVACLQDLRTATLTFFFWCPLPVSPLSIWCACMEAHCIGFWKFLQHMYRAATAAGGLLAVFTAAHTDVGTVTAGIGCLHSIGTVYPARVRNCQLY